MTRWLPDAPLEAGHDTEVIQLFPDEPLGDGYCTTSSPNGPRSMISMRVPQGSVM
jgi:hypothetical protein